MLQHSLGVTCKILFVLSRSVALSSHPYRPTLLNLYDNNSYFWRILLNKLVSSNVASNGRFTGE